MKNSKRRINNIMTPKDYVPFNGFYNLLAFDIPKKEFNKMYNIQEYLAECEEKRKSGRYKHDVHGLNKVKDLSAQYQQLLFSYPIINQSLI